jgi:hypothetical protein
MKKILKFIVILVVTFHFTSCEETKPVVFDPTTGQSLFAFGTSSASLEIKDSTGEGSIEVMINSTTTSSSDRTISISVDDSASNAEASQYSFPENVTIAAGAHSSSFTIQGLKAGNIELGIAKQLVINLTSSTAGGILSSEPLSVSLVLFCDEPSALPDTLFVGNYLMEQTSDYLDGPTLSDGSIVAFTKVDDNTREFQTETYPDYCGGSFQAFQMKFICGQVIVPTQNSICACVSGADWYSGATVPTTYDESDDSVFFMTFTDDSNALCPTGTQQTTYKFTKQ